MNNNGHNNICVTCAYFQPDPQARAADFKSKAGQCRRHPPQTTMIPIGGPNHPQMAASTHFPMVQEIMWCGEHSEFSKMPLGTVTKGGAS